MFLLCPLKSGALCVAPPWSFTLMRRVHVMVACYRFRRDKS